MRFKGARTPVMPAVSFCSLKVRNPWVERPFPLLFLCFVLVLMLREKIRDMCIGSNIEDDHTRRFESSRHQVQILDSDSRFSILREFPHPITRDLYNSSYYRYNTPSLCQISPRTSRVTLFTPSVRASKQSDAPDYATKSRQHRPLTSCMQYNNSIRCSSHYYAFPFWLISFVSA